MPAVRHEKIRASSARPRKLATDRRGAAALEFALVATPLFALIVATFQLTLTFLAQQALETASDKAVRQLITGTAQKSNMTATDFSNLVCSKLPSFMKCANVMIDVRSVSTFSDADTTSPTITYGSDGKPSNTWAYAPGGAGQITITRIMYIWSVQAGPLGFNISNMTGGRRLLTAVNVFQTETYT